MKKEHKYNIQLLSFMLLLVIGVAVESRPVTASRIQSETLSYATPNESAHYRQARRLQTRLAQRSMHVPSLDALVRALTERRNLLARQVTVTLLPNDSAVLSPWIISLHRYPLWLRGTFSADRAVFALDRERITNTLEQNGIEHLPRPTSVQLMDILTDDRGVERAITDVTKPGYIFDVPATAAMLDRALYTDTSTATLAVMRSPGKIMNETGKDLGALTLLAEGRSNFAGSITGRVANVRKGLKERVNNVLVAPDGTFSFNDTLGNVTAANGWYEALGIFNGDELRPVRGGGICQVATTVYRAIIHAGFPIGQRRQHSLYVAYYEKYGVGLDATVFPGHQDLTFKNDTGNWLLLQSYYDGFEAFVNVYGTGDGRSVDLEGPYFTTTAPASVTSNGRPLAKNEIAWIQEIRHTDGRTERNTLVSRYKSLPKNIALKYATPTKTASILPVPVHAAAEDLVSVAR